MQTRKSGNAQGVDVSHWNGAIDWPKVAASSISFTYIKAIQNSVDKRFVENANGAKAAGLLIGAYHYLPIGSRKVNGINGVVDLNEYDGTEAELRAKYGEKKGDVTRP